MGVVMKHVFNQFLVFINMTTDCYADPVLQDSPIQPSPSKRPHLLSTPDLSDVMENVENVAVSSRCLLDFARQRQARHRDDVKGKPYQRLCVVEPLEEDARRRHRNLRKLLAVIKSFNKK